MNDENIILRWSGIIPDTPSYVSWYIRGIFLDGRFYGEVIIREPGNGRTSVVEGKLTDQDNVELHKLINEMIE